jgi:8-amino-7-oxononanoate synthase
MDGDMPDMVAMIDICATYNAYLIVDEAHAVGVIGGTGTGLLQSLNLEKEVFVRIVTFGKALGCHGAVVLASQKVVEYLVNFARSFIYTTGLSPHAVATVQSSYAKLFSAEGQQVLETLQENIAFFSKELQRLGIQERFIPSTSAIHCCIVGGSEETTAMARAITNEGFDVKPILSPTVPVGKERIRFCLHAYNSKEEIKDVLEKFAIFVTQSDWYVKQCVPLLENSL